VTTVHDAIPWTVGEYRKNSLLGRLYNAVALRMAAKADQVITVSKASKKEIAELKKIPKEKIQVVYNACSYSGSELIDQREKSKVLKKYGINPEKPYLFYLGGYDKRKNVLRLVEIFLSKISDGIDVQLVLGGAKVLQNKLFGELDEIKESIINNDKVLLTGFVEERDLPCLYESAAAFITLSKNEGFNLNLLEAMSLKTPVIASDLPVHREIAGPGAVLVDLEKSNREIGEQIVNLLKDKKYYNKWREKASTYVSPFSWQKASEEIHKIYKQLT
jgi:glycosyltransferase involved in cell wall biosynthesis